MPTYEYACESCEHECELVHSMRECDSLHECPKCRWPMHRKISLVAIKPPADAGWEFEGNGRGRYISQLELPLEEKVDAGMDPKKPDPFAYCRSRQEIVEKCAKRGKKILSGAPRSARTLKTS